MVHLIRRPSYKWMQPHQLRGPSVSGRVLPVLTCVMSLLASSARALRAQAPVTRDSAGIRIVENPSRKSAPVAFALGAQLMDVGGVEANPDEEFDHNQGYLRAARLSDGGIAVIDVARVHCVDSKGKRVKIVGRKGQGPQEFLYLTAICRTRGDTVLVGDQNNCRVAVLDKNGAVVRTIEQGGHGGTPFSFCFDDGTFVRDLSVSTADRIGGTHRLTRINLDGSVANVIGELPGFPFDMVAQASVSVVAAGTRLYYGNPSSSEIQVFSTTGQLLSILRSDDSRPRISSAEAEARMASTIPRNVTEAERSTRMDRMRAMPHADAWPAYQQVLVDPSGRVWVQDHRVTYPSPDGWSAFDANGRLIGRLQLPSPAAGKRPNDILAFDTDRVLVRRSDADDAAHLTWYALQRTGNSR